MDSKFVSGSIIVSGVSERYPEGRLLVFSRSYKSEDDFNAAIAEIISRGRDYFAKSPDGSSISDLRVEYVSSFGTSLAL